MGKPMIGCPYDRVNGLTRNAREIILNSGMPNNSIGLKGYFLLRRRLLFHFNN